MHGNSADKGLFPVVLYWYWLFYPVMTSLSIEYLSILTLICSIKYLFAFIINFKSVNNNKDWRHI